MCTFTKHYRDVTVKYQIEPHMALRSVLMDSSTHAIATTIYLSILYMYISMYLYMYLSIYLLLPPFHSPNLSLPNPLTTFFSSFQNFINHST